MVSFGGFFVFVGFLVGAAVAIGVVVIGVVIAVEVCGGGGGAEGSL